MAKQQKFTFNWGWGILIFFTSFVVFMIYMVYLTSTVDHDLVTSDYYQQEIEFQKKIDMKNNLARTGMHIQIHESDDALEITLPTLNQSKITSAHLHVYRPSDETKDLKLDQHENGIFVIPANLLIKGTYLIKAEWEADKTKYYEEVSFTKR